MSGKQFQTVKIEKGEGISWLIMNRPDKRNAMSPQLHYEADEALAELAFDSETRVLVLTGAGEAFSAGQDLRLFFRANDGKPEEFAKVSHAANSWRWERLSKFPKPTIAMINGFCFGGAFTQVCACDFAIAAEDALFGLSEINWGILPGGLVSWNVADVMGYRDALYYAMTGDTFDGRKAAEIRFVNYAVPGTKLKEETIALAKKLITKNPTVLRYVKEAIRSVRRMNVEQAHDYLAAKLNALRFEDPEHGRDRGLKQFLDDKVYRPGFEPYKREVS
jgi:feruloyl-CoA hydratase/lyase